MRQWNAGAKSSGLDAFPYVWAWRQRTIGFSATKVPWFGDGVDRTGLRCRVLARGSRNSGLIEFEDGYQVITSRGGLRRR